MEIDVDTGVTDIRQFYALDDCGTRINPMIIEGQIHGGLTEALAVALGQEIAYDDMGNVKTGTLMDFFLPTAGRFQITKPITPSPHHRITQSVQKVSAKAHMWAVCPVSQTLCMMHSAPLVCVKPTCRTIIGGFGARQTNLACTINPENIPPCVCVGRIQYSWNAP